MTEKVSLTAMESVVQLNVPLKVGTGLVRGALRKWQWQ